MSLIPYYPSVEEKTYGLLEGYESPGWLYRLREVWVKESMGLEAWGWLDSEL